MDIENTHLTKMPKSKSDNKTKPPLHGGKKSDAKQHALNEKSNSKKSTDHRDESYRTLAWVIYKQSEYLINSDIYDGKHRSLDTFPE